MASRAAAFFFKLKFSFFFFTYFLFCKLILSVFGEKKIGAKMKNTISIHTFLAHPDATPETKDKVCHVIISTFPRTSPRIHCRQLPRIPFVQTKKKFYFRSSGWWLMWPVGRLHFLKMFLIFYLLIVFFFPNFIFIN